MGADMVIACVAVEVGKKVNHDAGAEFVKNLVLDEQLIEELINYGGLDEDEFFEPDSAGNPKYHEIKQWLLDSITDFENAIEGRGAATIQVRDVYLTMIGGMSWGDMPEGAEYIARMEAVPGLLGAMGYCTDWFRPAEVGVSPEAEAQAIESIKSVVQNA